ncbi:glycosyltransferase [Kordiimonas sp. SCSIO 12603]|uniref:glycosyltransferase n=1 Tax=Kordiimonas sp. SCSIO 12603 TaxID=2829596 RepID=UPI002107FA03|nr:glycosyltransferase [Kordiimonas sp. SCSIO 12603]UTW57589.1 glycosyltransferase [Kordiimonas sp. SCSIO 12603]
MQHLLAQKDVEVTVIAPVPWFPFKGKVFGSYGRSAAAPSVEIRKGVTVYHPRYLVIPKVGMLLTPWFLFRSAKRLISKLLKKGMKFDIIDAHYLYPDGVSASKLAKEFNLPFVMTARGSDVTEIGLMNKPAAMICEATAAAQHIITVSNNLKRDLIEMGVDGNKVTTLRNGVDLARFQEKRRSELRSQYGSKPTMVFAGWLIPRKRIDLVLEVTKLIPDLQTVIAGDGPLKAEMESRATSLGIADRVFFVGQKTPEQMPEIYSSGDILLLPSDREGWANVLLEAMACGTPVVTRSIGGAPDLITDDVAGRVVDSEEPIDIAEAVKDLLHNLPERKAVRDFAQNFDWHATSDGQMQIFEKAIRDHNETEK